MSSGQHHQTTLRPPDLPTPSKEDNQKLVELLEDDLGGIASDMDDGVKKTNRQEHPLNIPEVALTTTLFSLSGWSRNLLPDRKEELNPPLRTVRR